MDLSALERAARASENCLDALGFWLFFFTALVVIGLIAEYRHEVVEFWEEIRRPAAMFPWQKFWAITGGVLVTIGVAGELVVGIKSSREETNLRNTNRQIVGLLNQETADARRDAEQAKERTAKLQAAMMLRHLSKEQGDALCLAIPKPHVNEVNVTSSSQDWESFRYAQDFNEALRRCTISAGLQPSGGVGNSFWSQNVPFGVWVRYQRHLTLDDPRSPNLTINPIKRRALAWAIRDALEAHGVKIEDVTDEAQTVVDIFVGPRRPPTDAELETAKPSSSNPTTSH